MSNEKQAERQKFLRQMKEENHDREIIVKNLQLQVDEMNYRNKLRQVIPMMEANEYTVIGMDIQRMIAEDVPKIVSGEMTVEQLNIQVEDYFLLRIESVNPQLAAQLKAKPEPKEETKAQRLAEPGSATMEEVQAKEGRVIDFPVVSEPEVVEIKNADQVQNNGGQPGEA